MCNFETVDITLLKTVAMNDLLYHYYTICTKKYFQTIVFLIYSGPYLKGTKDALWHKFRRFMIGQNCSAACINEGGYKDAFSNERCEALHISRGLLGRT